MLMPVPDVGFPMDGGSGGDLPNSGVVKLALPAPLVLKVPGRVKLRVVSDTLGDMAGVSVPNAPETFEIKRNDLLPTYDVEVFDADDQPVDLSAATDVFFTMQSDDATLKINRQPGSVELGSDSVTQSVLRYPWSAGDTDESGRFIAEFEVVFAAGKRTFPASRLQALEIQIIDDLDAT